ncbi:MAG: enoyl-CoA hydratase [Candidatus Rokubacteria bacterium]|nr:enoyl-CoA hydratase [Candidatus Rokubacteria bacterium]
MGHEQIVYEVQDRIATVMLNRPDKLNAWTHVMGREVRAAMEEAGRDDGVRVIVLTGAGRGFCAGADMDLLSGISGGGVGAGREAARPAATTATAGGPAGEFRGTYAYFPTIPKPIIAALNGPTAGLGLVIALYCDLRFAGDAAVFTTAFSRRGLIAEHGISWMLPKLAGLSQALDLVLSARKVDAAEALRIGLVNRVLPQGELMAGVREYARELADMVSPRSMRVIKRQLWNAQFQTLAEATAVADREMVQSFDSADFKEGVAHFVEKRAPRFTGR